MAMLLFSCLLYPFRSFSFLESEALLFLNRSHWTAPTASFRLRGNSNLRADRCSPNLFGCLPHFFGAARRWGICWARSTRRGRRKFKRRGRRKPPM